MGFTETDAPVPTGVPPHEAEYQRHVAPALNVPVTCSVEFVPEHTGEVPVAESGLFGIEVTVTVVFTQPE